MNETLLRNAASFAAIGQCAKLTSKIYAAIGRQVCHVT